jgi:hypothetical protein
MDLCADRKSKCSFSKNSRPLLSKNQIVKLNARELIGEVNSLQMHLMIFAVKMESKDN